MDSRYFGARTVKQLNRFGDILLPEHDAFPSFSQLGCIERIDVMAVNISVDDRRSLGAFMFLSSLCPSFVPRWIVRKMEDPSGMPDVLASLFRTLNLGLRGILFSLYYSGEKGKNYRGRTPLEIIGFELTRLGLAQE